MVGCKNGGAQVVTERGPTDGVVNTTRNSDGYLRMEEELDRSEKNIKDYLDTLSKEDLILLVVETNNQGNGSLESLKDALAMAKDLPPLEGVVRPTSPEWCKCRKCVEMPTEIENKCCKRKNCLTNSFEFKKYCLDKQILELHIKARADMRADEFNFATNELRKAAYQLFTLWRYGKLGLGIRKTIPSFVVVKIRERFPSRDGVYMGYKES